MHLGRDVAVLVDPGVLVARSVATTELVDDHDDEPEDSEVDAAVEEQRGRQVLAQERAVQRCQVGTLQEAQQSGAQSQQHADADERVAQVVGTQLPGAGLREVPEEQATGCDERREEATARGVVAPPEGDQREDDHDRDQRVQRHARQDRVQVGGAQVLGVERCQLRNLVDVRETGLARCAESLGRRAWAVARLRGARHGGDDRGDDDARHAEDDQLAQRIVATEFHQDRGDDVVRAGGVRGVLQIPLRQLRTWVVALQQPDAEESHQTHDRGDHGGEAGAILALAQIQARLVADHQHHNDGHAQLDQQVCLGDIRGAEGEHHEGDTHADHADEHDGGQARAGPEQGDERRADDDQADQVGDAVRALHAGWQIAETVQAARSDQAEQAQGDEHRQDPEHVAVGGHGVGWGGDNPAEADHPLRDQVDDLRTCEGAERLVLEPAEDGLALEDSDHAQHHHDHGDHERGVHPVPHRQVRVRLAHAGGHGDVIQPALRPGQEEDGGQGEQTRQGSGQPEADRGLAGLGLVHLAIDEGAEDVAGGVHERRQGTDTSDC